MIRRIIFLILVLIGLAAHATHQRAGEISYRAINSLTYEITVVTYTYTPSPADRPELEISWGDGTVNTVQRIQKSDMGGDISKNVYKAQHTYPGASTFKISIEDPNRNAGIINIPNSVNIPFYLETELIIHPFLGGNNSPVLLNPPIDNGCVNVPYYHNPGAYDPDGDSLVYSLVSCRGFDGEVIPGYALPYASASISINPQTGDLYWDSPVLQGEYNIAILIEEYRRGIKIGSMIRDMQITIGACDNLPPDLMVPADTCVLAGTLLQFNVTATDDTVQIITLSATGDALLLANSPASFTQNIIGKGSVSGTFRWQTECSHVRRQPYQITFKAKDDGIILDKYGHKIPSIPLTVIKSWRVTVVAPAPENVQAEVIPDAIKISWDKSVCANASGYKIYRRENSYPFTPNNCQTGLPEYTGYQLMTQLSGHGNTSFIDDGTLLPIYHGRSYCYRVVAVFPDFSESYVSDEVCTFLKKDVPFITHVTVEHTDTVNGKIQVRWSPPTDFDRHYYPGPYQYEVYRKSVSQNNFTRIATKNNILDTVFNDTGLNTAELKYVYKIAFINNTPNDRQLIGYSDPNTSIFLNLDISNSRLDLRWTEEVSWLNQEYTIFRWNEDAGIFDSLTTTTQRYYADQNLRNGKTYRYCIRSKGAYFVPDTIMDLYNLSQIIEGTPYDDVPPETPKLNVTSDCENVYLTWEFSHPDSLKDVEHYYIYFKPDRHSDFKILDSLINQDHNITSYTLYNPVSVVGCYAISALDSNRNKTPVSQVFCFDTDLCPGYLLPNVFTPNGDGINDVFQPFPYSNVESVRMFIYNRWGRLVFQTTNPDILWDGKQSAHAEPVNGVYYYICEVFEHSLDGIRQRILKGSVTIIK